MSVDKLQEKIRKTKNPSVIDFGILPAHIPPVLLQEEGSFVRAYGRFCMELLESLRDIVPAVRFSFAGFAVLGTEGIMTLSRVLSHAKKQGYYVLLDVPEALSQQSAQFFAQELFRQENTLEFDGVILSSYIGVDGLLPYAQMVADSGKALFTVIRTANRSAPQLQDLLTGSRVVHMSVAESVNRLGENMIGKSGYSQIAGVAAASSADGIRILRSKFSTMFLLLDGYDYPNANAKNCSYGFDRLGYGAIVCAGISVTAAWTQEFEGAQRYQQLAVEAAQRMKKNICSYITVL